MSRFDSAKNKTIIGKATFRFNPKNITLKYFKIYTLGCKVNDADSRELAGLLWAQGWREATELESPAWVIVNSCAVTLPAITKTRRLVNQLKKKFPEAKLILTGCYPKIYLKQKQKFNSKESLGADEIIFNSKQLVARAEKIIQQSLSNGGGKIDSERKITCQQNASPLNKRARYFLKIQDGCNQFCSYCVIPYARNRIVNKSKAKIVKEVEQAIEAGYREIVLCGIHLGRFSFQSDGIGTGEDLAKLLKDLIKIKGLGRLRLSSIEITEVTAELIALIKNSARICPHLHISLQSGSDKILCSMKRPYRKKLFLEKVRQIINAIPQLALTTDVIVGFPGETDDDFSETMDFVKKIGFAKVHVFPFSPHKKAPAGKFKNQVDTHLKKKRAAALREPAGQLEKRYLLGLQGKKVKIVAEKIVGQEVVGRSEYYCEATAKIETKNIKRGQLIMTRL